MNTINNSFIMDSNSELELELDTLKVCRICLLESKYLFNIFSYSIVKGFIVSLPEMIKNCLEIELNDESQTELPVNICNICKQQIVNFYSFKQKCKKSEQLLRCSLVKTNSYVKKELALELEVEEIDSLVDYDLDIQNIEQKHNNSSNIRRSKRSKVAIVPKDENIDAFSDDDNESFIKTEYDNSTEFDYSVETDDLDGFEGVSDDCNTDDDDDDENDCDTTTTAVNSTTSTSQKYANTEINQKVCKICNKIFETTNNLKRHMEAHIGVKYKCRICSKIYIHQASRNRHMRLIHPAEIKLLLAKKDNPFSRNDPKNPPFNKIKNNSKTITTPPAVTTITPIKCNNSVKIEIIDDADVKDYYLTTDVLDDVNVNKTVKLNHQQLIAKTQQVSGAVNLDTNLIGNYFCELCEIIFPNRMAFIKHCKTHDYYCRQCCKVFLSSIELDKHISNHTYMDTYTTPIKSDLYCIYCQKRLKSQYQYDQHFKLHENLNFVTNKLTFHSCHTCYMMFLTETDLNEHNQTHPTILFLDDDRSCTDYQFLDDEKLNYDENINKCGICEKLYPSIKDLKTHIILHLEKFSCPFDDCGCVYDMFSRLSIHISTKHLTNDNKEFNCIHCNDSIFLTYDDLQQHIKNDCKERKFQCNHCVKKFFSKKALMHHLKNSKEKKFMCQYCGKSFAQQGELKIHDRSHTGERPFQCTVCNKSYKTASMRTSHMDVHSLKTFSCTICGKQLKTRTSFRNHMKRHNEEKKHSCEICLKRFYTKYHVKLHSMKVHQNTKKVIL